MNFRSLESNQSSRNQPKVEDRFIETQLSLTQSLANPLTVMQKVASELPTPWELPDIVVILFLPIAVFCVLIDALAFRSATYAKVDTKH